MTAPKWLPVGLRGDHAGPLNAKVHRILKGIYDADDAQAALIELFRSDEVIDPHVRAAIADALEADQAGRTRAFRLKIRKPTGRPRTWNHTMEQIEQMQAIAARFQELTASGLTRQKAIGQLEDDGVAKRSKIEEALAYAERAIIKVESSSD